VDTFQILTHFILWIILRSDKT